MSEFDYWKLTTFCVATFAAYIAWRQSVLAKEKLRLELFEKRFAVFVGTRMFLTHVFRKGNPEDADIWEYRAAIGEASFLFRQELVDYLEEIYSRAISLKAARETLGPLPIGEERSRLSNEISDGVGWLTEQLPKLKETFAPYLKFDVWR